MGRREISTRHFLVPPRTSTREDLVKGLSQRFANLDDSETRQGDVRKVVLVLCANIYRGADPPLYGPLIDQKRRSDVLDRQPERSE